MMCEQSEIPYAIADDISNGDTGPGLRIEEAQAPRTSLESERFGLLAPAKTIVGTDRRIEEWIASKMAQEYA